MWGTYIDMKYNDFFFNLRWKLLYDSPFQAKLMN